MKNDNTHKGMKFTEVGWIPKDWEIKEIQNVAPLQRGFDLPTQSIVDGTYPVVYSNGILNYHKEAPCQAPGLVTGRSGTIGKFFFIPEGGYWPHNTTLWVTTFKGNYPLYIKYLYETVGFENFSTGTGVPTLNRNELHIYKVALPSSPSEQKRIASVLSDMDSLISSLSSTIEKKRLIKKGTMQQLLSGERRLKGYTEEWVEDSLGEHGKFCGHAITPDSMPNELFVEYSMPAYDDGKRPTLTMGKEMLSARTSIEGEVLLINKLNVRQKRIWYIKQCEENAVCSGEFLPYKSTDIYLPFLQQMLLTDRVVEDFMELSTGTSNSQKRVTPKQILNYIIKFPKDWNEQFAIASRLATMDDEILALEKELEKYKVLKQGMMQKLLTGQIRLKYKDIAYN